ncbi:MAG: DHHA1 domain-containing protein [Candidatus Woesearchaeota archaeon]
MLTEKEIKEFRDALKSSKRPIIFFDDDTDGLSSYLLFYHYLKDFVEDVRGIIVKSSPMLKDEIYSRRIEEYQPDKVFILDKPLVHQDFLDRIKVPVYWLDHHPVQDKLNVHYFNPLKHKAKGFDNDNRPTTYWAYKIIEEPDNFLWIAMVGCSGDWFIPEFHKKFIKMYPDLWDKKIKIRNPGSVLYETRLGVLNRIIQFNTKGSIKEVQDSIRVIRKIKNPYDIIDRKTPEGKFIYKRYSVINKIYEDIKSRVKISKDKIILFVYDDNHSVTGDLSNEIQYHYPDKLILIAREKTDIVVCSLRSENLNIRNILEKSLVGINGHGGGHEHACGASVEKKDFDKFVSNIRENVKKQQKIKIVVTSK